MVGYFSTLAKTDWFSLQPSLSSGNSSLDCASNSKKRQNGLRRAGKSCGSTIPKRVLAFSSLTFQMRIAGKSGVGSNPKTCPKFKMRRGLLGKLGEKPKKPHFHHPGATPGQ